MKRLLAFMLFAVFAAVSATAQKANILRYDITGAGSGQEEKVLVKVFVYSKTNKVSDEDLKRAAVHGLVFRDLRGNLSGAVQPAMAPESAEEEYAEFFAAFFAPEGEALKYAEIVEGSHERVKIPKGFKIGAILNIDKFFIRRALEKAGVIEKLGSNFEK